MKGICLTAKMNTFTRLKRNLSISLIKYGSPDVLPKNQYLTLAFDPWVIVMTLQLTAYWCKHSLLSSLNMNTD
jgi:hypothetical protein